MRRLRGINPEQESSRWASGMAFSDSLFASLIFFAQHCESFAKCIRTGALAGISCYSLLDSLPLGVILRFLGRIRRSCEMI